MKQKKIIFKNNIISKINSEFLTGIFFIIVGILTIIDPGYVQAKWGNDAGWEIQFIFGSGLIIVGSFKIIYQSILIYKSYKKDKENNRNDNF
ncbi:hypothetical protein [Aliarcobacter cryaerophilus]|uniref:hypothetical protein n=1 Tax=Aliarcobacter cryaerophilus TaxID=28198 RepID=UPI0011DF6753|nr:hypothetical protein [Aliarcobacter cryaerophilus]